jgi:hypothetical protein
MAVVHALELAPVLRREVLVRELRRSWLHVVLMHGRLFLCGGLAIDTTMAVE